METLTIYHNPRCSKSRTALALLQERSVPLEIVEYLKHPPTRAQLKELRQKLDLTPGQWVRKGEPEYKAAGLGNDSTEDQILDAMAKCPVLIERPVVVRGTRAVVGRPPERVIDLLES
ncbi:MAG TPA: arsenate reductase (glutaredoxin) [Candidatus Acidoferrales bacterium]|nr:arsenate reductase (glutaredoxin) [Candidatus Acidoferrales bacterium]